MKIEASETSVGFEIQEALLDLHPVPVEIHHQVGFQELSVGNRNQLIPGFLIGWIIINIDLCRNFAVRVIENILITEDLSWRRVELS